MTWKQTRFKIKISSLGVQKAFKFRSQKQSKIDENPVPDHLASILLLPWSSRVVPKCQDGPPGCSQDAKTVPQAVKLEARMAATAYKWTASSPCNRLPATCYPRGSAMSPPRACSTRGCQSWQQPLLLLPWQKPTYVQVSLSAQPARPPTVPPASCGPPGCEGRPHNI